MSTLIVTSEIYRLVRHILTDSFHSYLSHSVCFNAIFVEFLLFILVSDYF